MGHRPRSRTVLALGCASLAVIALAPSSLFGSIEDQRARLPPAATPDGGADCSDPAAGEWIGQQYNAGSRSWQRYRLTIRRREPGANALVGEVRVHYWTGPMSQSTPPAQCAAGQQSVEVAQNATGAVDGDSLYFGGNDWRTSQVFCNRAGAISYNPDRFSGTIDRAIQEFQSVNNDGGSAVNEPVVFRRVQCPQRESERPQAVVVLPPTTPTPLPEPERRPRALFRCSR
jgi:hypothetical protein